MQVGRDRLKRAYIEPELTKPTNKGHTERLAATKKSLRIARGGDGEK